MRKDGARHRDATKILIVTFQDVAAPFWQAWEKKWGMHGGIH